MRRLLPLLFVLTAGLGSCKNQVPAPASVRCFVAASTKDAFAEIAKQYGEEHKVQILVTDDDSAKLAMQIENGAEADIFLSASERWTNHLREKRLTKMVTSLLTNRLVLIVPKANPGKVEKLDDLLGSSVHRVAVAGPNVPAGEYARQALLTVKLWDALEKAKKIVSGENVRTTLAYVERGEVEAGVVYRTDADISTKVNVIHTFAKDDHSPIIYPLALLKRAEDNDAAKDFFDYLQGSKAAERFRNSGFGVVGLP